MLQSKRFPSRHRRSDKGVGGDVHESEVGGVEPTAEAAAGYDCAATQCSSAEVNATEFPGQSGWSDRTEPVCASSVRDVPGWPSRTGGAESRSASPIGGGADRVRRAEP